MCGYRSVPPTYLYFVVGYFSVPRITTVVRAAIQVFVDGVCCVLTVRQLRQCAVLSRDILVYSLSTAGRLNVQFTVVFSDLVHVRFPLRVPCRFSRNLSQTIFLLNLPL